MRLLKIIEIAIYSNIIFFTFSGVIYAVKGNGDKWFSRTLIVIICTCSVGIIEAIKSIKPQH